jgi:hypothetical protein
MKPRENLRRIRIKKMPIDEETLKQKMYHHYSIINATSVEILNMQTFEYFPRYGNFRLGFPCPEAEFMNVQFR